GDCEHDRLVAGAARNAAVRILDLRGLKHQDVAENDAGHVLAVRALYLPRADHVDVIARLERAREQLVGVAGQLERAKVAGQLSPDALLAFGGEAQERDLLAGVDRLRRDLARQVLRLHDRSRSDRGLRDLRARELARDVVTGRAGSESSF